MKSVMCPSALHFFLFMAFFGQAISAEDPVSPLFPRFKCSNITSDSAYNSQLDTLFSSITTNNSVIYGFFHAASAPTSQNSDTPNVIGLCRGDQRTQACRTCLNDSVHKLTQSCPNDKEAIVFNGNCTLRYSNKRLLGQAVTSLLDGNGIIFHNIYNASNPATFNKEVRDIFDTLQTEVASGGSLRKFAVNRTVFDNSTTIFASAQCTPDLSEQQCKACLTDIYIDSRLSPCCFTAIGIVLMSPSCSFRFETYPFIDESNVEPLPSPPQLSATPTASSPQPSATPTASTSPQVTGSNTTRTIILIMVPIVIAVILIIFIIVFLKMKKEKKPSLLDTTNELRDVEYVQYDLSTIKAATNNFSMENKLGQGGFGAVYKGKLPNGQVIAVKRLSRGSRQGELEFKNEVILLIKLQHRNLVRLQGFSLEGNEKLLIYEFLENSSLDHFIFNPNEHKWLDWDTRYKIIIGIARGLLYLHEDSRLRIIHRDLKASNILLDAEMNPKISDFGLAKLFVLNQTQADTSRIVGTYGYMAPEYAMHGKFSIKSDVYSFGVLVLEIVSGEKISGFHSGEHAEDLLNFAWRNWTEGTLSKVIDPTLKFGSREEMGRCIHIGLLCVQQNVAMRPTMALVVHMLNSDSTTLALPSQPACFMHDDTTLDMFSTQEHTSKGSNSSKKDVSLTELYPR